jgi:glyoxylase-like metal-dependent hydrolase (beta-lactamase superfamily II)
MTELTQWRPGLWLVDLTSDLIDVRGALIIGEHSVLVWDTLSHPRDMAALSDLIADKQVIIVYSHADWDHVWGTSGLIGEQTCGPIIAHDLCRARFDDAEDVNATLNEFRSSQPGAWDEVTLIPPTITFGSTLTIDLGGVTVELHHLPGHTPDCLVALIPAWGVLLAGDTVETPFPIVNDGAALPRWIDLLARWANDERVTTVIPCHGEIGDRSLIERNIAYLASLTSATPAEGETDSTFYSKTHLANIAKTRSERPESVTLRPFADADRPWVERFLTQEWGSEAAVLRGQVYHPAQMAGFLAERSGKPLGLITYDLRGDACEIMTLNSLGPNQGIGQTLIDAVIGIAQAATCRRVIVVTTNDNLHALRFYQRRGFVLAEVRLNAVAHSRLLKPQIPLLGADDIPLRDEIELVLTLSTDRNPTA